MLRTILLALICCLPGPAVSAQTTESAADKQASVLDVFYPQIMRPGAAKDLAGKMVRFNTTFFNTAVSSSDLPEKYRDGVRLILCAQAQVNSCEGVYANAVIAKSKSAALRDIKNGDQVRITALADKFALPAVRKTAPKQVPPEPVVSSDTAKEIQVGKLKLAKLEPPAEAKQAALVKQEEYNEGLILQVESIELVK